MQKQISGVINYIIRTLPPFNPKIMKKTLMFVVLATTVSCGWNNLLDVQEKYVWPDNVDVLLPGKWQLTTLDGVDASENEIILEFRADSTYWRYSLLDSVIVTATDSIPVDSLAYYVTWRIDEESQLIRLTSFTKWEPFWYVNVDGDSVQSEPSFFEWTGGNYKINLITEEKLIIKQTVDYVGFDPFYGSGGGGSVHRDLESYARMP